MHINEKLFHVVNARQWLEQKIKKNYPELNQDNFDDIIDNINDFLLDYIEGYDIKLNKKYIKYLQSLNPKTNNKITLYRGISINKQYKSENINLKLNKISSWSTDYKIALGFAKFYNKRYDYVLKTMVNYSNVLIDVRELPSQYQIYIRQKELILLPGEYNVSVEDVTQKQTKMFEDEIMIRELYKRNLKEIKKSGGNYSVIFNQDNIPEVRLTEYIDILCDEINNGKTGWFVGSYYKNEVYWEDTVKTFPVLKNGTKIQMESYDTKKTVDLVVDKIEYNFQKPYHKIFMKIISGKENINEDFIKIFKQKQPLENWEFDVKIIGI